MDSKVAIAGVGAITIISLAIVLVVVPILLGKDPCTEVESPAGKFKFCQGEPPVALERSAPPSNIGLPSPPQAPTNATEIVEMVDRRVIEDEMTLGITAPTLDSIIGNWNVEGQTTEGLQFVGTFSFNNNNQFAAIYNINGFLQPVQYGTYDYSQSQRTLTLTYYGQNPDFYTVDNITESTFKITGVVGIANFART